MTLGATKLYTVYRRLSAQTGNSTTWRARIETLDVGGGGADVDFDFASLVAATGEIIREGGLGGWGTGDVDGCYGCTQTSSGLLIRWQRTTAAGSTQWTDIQSAHNINTDSRWEIGSLPGAWSIRHRCQGAEAC